MEDLKNISTEELLEMLTIYTSDYIQMIKDGAPDIEFSRFEFVISMIQNEIRYRGGKLSTPEIDYTTDRSG